MYEVFRSFFLDGATFKRVTSDAIATASVVAVTPELHPFVVSLFPGAGWLPPALLALSVVYSARARQVQTPPK